MINLLRLHHLPGSNNVTKFMIFLPLKSNSNPYYETINCTFNVKLNSQKTHKEDTNSIFTILKHRKTDNTAKFFPVRHKSIPQTFQACIQIQCQQK